MNPIGGNDGDSGEVDSLSDIEEISNMVVTETGK